MMSALQEVATLKAHIKDLREQIKRIAMLTNEPSVFIAAKAALELKPAKKEKE